MRILHLSWEYPPLVVGGLGRHVHALAEAQAANGHDVTVITSAASALAGMAADPGNSSQLHGSAFEAGVRIIRVEPDAPRLAFTYENLLAWVSVMEHAFIRAAVRIAHDWRPDVIHGHDWMVAHAGVAVRDILGAPLVTTIHATEAGRHQGWVSSPLNAAIHSVEWWLTNTADGVIACSQHMREEVMSLFDVPSERISVIPNGIDAAAWRRPKQAAAAARAQYAGEGPLLVYSGRVEWEKGVQTLLAAMPRLRRALPGVRLVIVGKGSHLQALMAQSQRLRLGKSVAFTGWVPEEQLHALVAAADLVIVPSLYEPFGLVALEAAALRTPLVVARTGGLAEFAADGTRAGTFAPGDPKALASAVIAAILDTTMRAGRVRRASQALQENHNWPDLAADTVAVYEGAAKAATEPGSTQRWVIRPPAFIPPLGNVLTGEPPQY